jgi:hypothetical protein
MNEIGQYQVFKEKLQGICDENSLTYSIQNNKYPFTMTIKPLGGLDSQLDMLEAMGENGNTGEGNDTGYISPDASLVFVYEDGRVIYKISETFTISDALFNKLKNLFKKMRDMYMSYFFRDVVTSGRLDVKNCDGGYTAPEDDPWGDYDGEDVETPAEEEDAADGDEAPESDEE